MKIAFSQVQICIRIHFLHKLSARLQCRAIFVLIEGVLDSKELKNSHNFVKTDFGIIFMAIRIIGGILTGAIDDVGMTVVLMSEVPK